MGARQRIARLLVPGQKESGRCKALHRVADFAAVLIRRPRKLALVDVRVTILAGRQLNLVNGPGPGGNVALLARNLEVFLFQRVGRSRMFSHSEGRRFEAVQGMASSAVAASLAGHELPLVRVRMAVRTAVEREWPIEVTSLVAGITADGSVLTEQWVLGFGVVERRTDLGWRGLFPARGRMTNVTRRLKGAAVRVRVAVRALAERDTYVLHRLRVSWFRLVTFLARDLGMKARKGVASPRVVKARNGLPVAKAVALRAVLPEAAPMQICMTREAVPREAQKGPVEILNFNCRALGG
jgi:hypothetical protein